MSYHKEVAFVLFVCSCFLGWASATYCTVNSDCGILQSCCSDSICRQTCYSCSYSYQCGTGECCTSSGKCETPCSDGVCRETCYDCSKSSQCGPGECCNSNGDCKLDCSITGGVIAVIVVICCLVVAAIVVSFVAYFYCERCPFYRGHLRPRQFMQSAQPMGMTTTVATQQNIPPPAGYNPPNAGYNSPPASGYSQFKD